MFLYIILSLSLSLYLSIFLSLSISLSIIRRQALEGDGALAALRERHAGQLIQAAPNVRLP